MREISWRDIDLDNLSHRGYCAVVDSCDHGRKIFLKSFPEPETGVVVVGHYGLQRMWWEDGSLMIEDR